ncbi:hypothetical protein F0562_021843 [Nyssa sinensis]|uniref:Uncharacterized protein n=1 Tax=Nyssa sinensis TaxID=561372 RepID=A0A5J5BPB4_9ASTE|nr:hypothetical protein F0562_021843 [Nyssa sinensis]
MPIFSPTGVIQWALETEILVIQNHGEERSLVLLTGQPTKNQHPQLTFRSCASATEETSIVISLSVSWHITDLSMATASSNPSKKQNTNAPPKRGQIKAQMFESFVQTVTSVVSKAKEALGNIRRGSGSDSSSASTSPLPSAYNSDGNSNVL